MSLTKDGCLKKRNQEALQEDYQKLMPQAPAL